MGRLTADPELRTTNNGTSVTSFTVAVDRSFVRSGEERQTDFINIVAWRQSAEFVSRYFHKGSMIAVQGSIQTRNYEDKNGNRRTAVEIVADRVSFCGSKSESNTGTRYDNAPAPAFSSGSESTFSVLPDDDDTDYSFDGGASDDGLPF
jgi:single-strand DNA-binding protein